MGSENKTYKSITFPRREWKYVENILEEKGIYSSTRCCKELGKYKVREVYKTPWGDLVKIVRVKRYTKLEDIPTWKRFDKGMKISARKGEQYGNSKWDHILFKRLK